MTPTELPTETASLLSDTGSDEAAVLSNGYRQKKVSARIIPERYIHRVLPLALSASVAMAATAATTVYGYAVIMCADPAHCKDDERGSYAGAVALAAGIANVCGILALGPLQDAIGFHPKAGLFFWLLSRAMSVAVLAVAGKLSSVIFDLFLV